MQFIEKAANLVNHLGRPFQNLIEKFEPLHPLDDPAEWLRAPAYAPPAEINIAEEQKRIDQICGTTRNNESIYKLVWSGDTEYWDKFYAGPWNAAGQPMADPVRFPLIRHKVLRDSMGKKVRDVFPPRWLILTRIEIEQYARAWKRESWVFAPEIGRDKMIRPDEPPPVFWLWFATVAAHNDHCCGVKRKEKKMCYGKYAPPAHYHNLLYSQAQVDKTAKKRPFEDVGLDMIFDIADEYTGYKYELMQTKVEAEIFLENPLGLIGVEASLRAGIDTPDKARQVVKDFYDREQDALSKLV